MPISEETGFRKIFFGGERWVSQGPPGKKQLEISQGWIWRIWATFSNPLQVPVGVFGLLKGTFFGGRKTGPEKLRQQKNMGTYLAAFNSIAFKNVLPEKTRNWLYLGNWIIHWARRSFCLIFFWGFCLPKAVGKKIVCASKISWFSSTARDEVSSFFGSRRWELDKC